MKTRLAMLLGGLLLCWGVSARALGPQHMLQRVLLKVGLSEAQMAQVRELHFKAEREMIDIRYEQERAQLKLDQALDAEDLDRDKIFALIERVEALEVDKHKNRLGLMLDIRALMTPGQWRRLETLQKRRRERRQRLQEGRQ